MTDPLAEHRDEWQCRALRSVRDRTDFTGRLYTTPIGSVLLSILAHSYEDKLPLWLHAVSPMFASISTPFLTSCAKIDKRGHVVADVLEHDGMTPTRNMVIFMDQRGMEKRFRELADKLKFTDDERLQFFAAIKRWVVADYRLDPTMDPADPDARRLTH